MQSMKHRAGVRWAAGCCLLVLGCAGDASSPATERPPVLLINEGEANDWMHADAVTYSPGDGNLLLSVRNALLVGFAAMLTNA